MDKYNGKNAAVAGEGGTGMRHVQIDEELFMELLRFFFGSKDDQLEDRIRAGLQMKVDALARRERYAEHLKRKDEDASSDVGGSDHGKPLEGSPATRCEWYPPAGNSEGRAQGWR